MSYRGITIVQFTGLNSNVAPELIQDQEAREIMNFRMEKVGKLVSRNGTIFGLFTDFDSTQASVETGDSTGFNNEPLVGERQYEGYLENYGVLGLGEYILSNRWEDFDTDRFMVYVIRANDSANKGVSTTDYNQRMGFMFAPLTGQYKNYLVMQDTLSAAIGRGIDVHDKRTASPKTPFPHSEQLYAPNREIINGKSSDPTNPAHHWIEQYVDMNEYRHKLVVSDRTNGDMLLENDYDTRDVPEAQRSNRLYLRPNALELFDIDTVGIDLRLGDGQENDATEGSAGVDNGMALYDFQLPEKEMVPTEDGVDGRPVFANDDLKTTFDDYTEQLSAKSKLKNTFEQGQTKALMTLAWWQHDQDIPGNGPMYYQEYDGGVAPYNDGQYYIYTEIASFANWYRYHDCYLKHREDFVYTTVNEPSLYNDLLGIAELPSEEYETETGVIEESLSASVFIWDDMRVKYYPSHGTHEKINQFTANDWQYLLTQLDRIFDKADAGPKLKKLTPKNGVDQETPLGVWRYRFAWRYEDDSYSAPSADLICPDMMWSMIPKDRTVESGGNYERPVFIESEDYFKSLLSITANYTSYGVQLAAPFFANSSNEIGNDPSSPSHSVDLLIAEHIHAIKKKLYDSGHAYGCQDETFANLTTLQQKEDLSTLITLDTPDEILLDGVFAEVIAYSDHDIPFPGFKLATGYGSVNQFAYTVPLLVPGFQGVERYTWNSLFDNRGKIRLLWMKDDLRSNVKWGLLFFPGYNAGVGEQVEFGVCADSYSNVDLGSTVHPKMAPYTVGIKSSSYPPSTGIYLNIDGITADDNNDPQYDDDHPCSILRGVRRESDRLTFVKSSQDIPAEALARIIKTGYAEIPILANGDKVYFASDLLYTTVDYSDYDLPSSFDDSFMTGRSYDLSAKIGSPTTFVPAGNGELGSMKVMGMGRYSGDYNVLREWKYLDNMDVRVYLQGERLMAVEQITAQFPSSLLFKAPRVGLKIKAENVPTRAKKLLVYRTKASHANDWDPDVFGLVKEIDIERDADGNAITADIIDDSGNTATYNGMYFFDDVRDNQLDFTINPSDREGLRDPLHSRFNIPLNERVYYLNFKQRFQLQKPREDIYGSAFIDGTHDETHIPQNITYAVLDSEEYDQGYDDSHYFWYKWYYEDLEGNYSLAAWSDRIEVNGSTGDRKSVALIFMPSRYEQYIDNLKVYRAEGSAGAPYYYVGEVEIEDEGIFIDDGLKAGAELPNLEAAEETYESGLMWSEPYTPDWIKIENFAEYRSGDGDQITGVTSQYGNLLIFKETSMHRVAVQAENPPLSRTDEISPDIGCIAPNTLINVNNMAYFLSWKGFMMYDNNVLRKIDTKFDEELQFLLSNLDPEVIRDATAGYNPAYNEIYLNIPPLPSEGGQDVNLQEDYGFADAYLKSKRHAEDYPGEEAEYFQRKSYGHIFVINPDKQYVTKFAYPPTVIDPVHSDPLTIGDWLAKEITDPSQMVRLYHTNSLGEMRSGDILPARYNVQRDTPLDDPNPNTWAGLYIETPYYLDEDNRRYEDVDHILLDQIGLYDFPKYKRAPVRSVFKSKFFTGNHESLIKRVRKVVANVFSKGYITMRGIVIPKNYGDDRLENVNEDYSPTFNEFVYNPTLESAPNPLIPDTVVSGTMTNIISFIPDTQVIAAGRALVKDDTLGKPIRFSVEIETTRRSQINQIELYWRPIHSYLA